MHILGGFDIVCFSIEIECSGFAFKPTADFWLFAVIVELVIIGWRKVAWQRVGHFDSADGCVGDAAICKRRVRIRESLHFEVKICAIGECCLVWCRNAKGFRLVRKFYGCEQMIVCIVVVILVAFRASRSAIDGLTVVIFLSNTNIAVIFDEVDSGRRSFA